MSKQTLETILGRCVMDADYRVLLFADPDQALAGYALTGEERAALLAIDAETLDDIAKRLGVHLGAGARQAGAAKSSQ